MDTLCEAKKRSDCYDSLCEVHTGEVYCDSNCGAKVTPETLEEYKAAFDHWQNHGCLGGCAHGC